MVTIGIKRYRPYITCKNPHRLGTVKPKKCTTFMLLSIFFKWLCQILFGQYRVNFFPNILGILIFLWYYEKNWLYTTQKSIWQSHLRNMLSSIKVVHFLVWLYNHLNNFAYYTSHLIGVDNGGILKNFHISVMTSYMP